MGKLLDDIEFPLCEVLASMEHIGILVDRNGIEAFGQELQTALGAELRAIYDEVGYEFNVNSPKQLGKALFEDLGLPTRKKRKAVIPPTPKRWRACGTIPPSSATSCSTEPTRS